MRKFFLICDWRFEINFLQQKNDMIDIDVMVKFEIPIKGSSTFYGDFIFMIFFSSRCYYVKFIKQKYIDLKKAEKIRKNKSRRERDI